MQSSSGTRQAGRERHAERQVEEGKWREEGRESKTGRLVGGAS